MGEANIRFARGEHEEAILMCMEIIRQGAALGIVGSAVFLSKGGFHEGSMVRVGVFMKLYFA